MYNDAEWEEQGRCDDIYGVYLHKPCGKKVMILMGHDITCPRCQREEWNKTKTGANVG